MGDVKAAASEPEKAAAATTNADDTATNDDKTALSELVVAAEKAVAAGGGDDNDAKALAALESLRGFKVTSALLLETGAGKRVRALSKESSSNVVSAAVAAAAKRVVAEWKAAVVGNGGGSGGSGNGNGGSGNRNGGNGGGGGGSAPSTSAPAEGNKKRPKEEEEEERAEGKAGEGRGEDGGEEAAAKKPKTEEEGKEEGKQAAKTETRTTEASQQQPPRPPPPPPPTGDPARDKARALLFAALDLVPAGDRNPAGACPATVAAAVEAAVLADHGDGSGARKLPGTRYKAKLRSLLFNLKDAANPDARRRALNGDLTPVELVRAGPEELASDARRAENEAIRAAALFEAERGAKKNLATTDQFRCGKCRERKCTYYQMQTRSADEPMTTFVQCVNCGNRWKFC